MDHTAKQDRVAVNQSGIKKIKVLIVDDHPSFRKGMELIFAKTPDILLAHGVGEGESALYEIRRNGYDLVLLDISLPDKSGLDVLKEIRLEYPHLPVIMLSMHPEDVYGLRFLKAGASGYLSKGAPVGGICEALRRVHEGGKYFGSQVMDQLAFEFEKKARKHPHEILSQRQFQIMCMLASGKTVSEVARELGLSLTTVSTHRSHILDKMKLRNNAQLMHYAMKHGLVK